MLVLSRKREEWVQIGEDVLIKIVSITGRKVKIGILAPADVVVLRGELLDDPDAVARVGSTGGFLVLTRAEKETIVMGSVTVTVLSVRTSVRLGIVAPRDIPVLRVQRAA